MPRTLLRNGCIAFALMLLVAASIPRTRAAPNSDYLPPGYAIDLLATIEWPAEIQCAADGRCFVASVHDPIDEERSAIWVINPDGSPQRIYRGPSYDPTLLGEKGLTGMVLHPRFPQDDRVFFYWNIPNHSRSEPTYSVISSIRSDGSDYHELWSFTPGGFTDSHVAGGMVTYSADGHDYLLVSIGEYGAGGSQDLTKTQGKVHRFEIVGDSLQAPGDNPFYNTPGAVQSIYAIGFRNPFRMSRDAATGKIYITENGFRCSDRVYLLVRGGNYGWPTWDGCQADPGYVQPIYEFHPTIGVTDVEVYHGSIPNWDGKVFICGFNSFPLLMLAVAPNDSLSTPQTIADGSHACLLGLATRADGSLLFSRQADQGEVLIVRSPTPQPRLNSTLTTNTSQPASGQRIHYALDVSSLSAALDFTATLSLPDQLIYLPASTFGGAVYMTGTRQIQWTPQLETNRSLRAGFDATTFAAPNTPITVTAYLTDSSSLSYSASSVMTTSNGSPLNVSVVAVPSAIPSGQSTMLQFFIHNRSISDTTFALTTTLPGEAQFVQPVFTATTTYDDVSRAIHWQRSLESDRQAIAAVVISATQLLHRTIGFTTTVTADDTSSTFLTSVMLDPVRIFLPIISKETGAASYRLAPDNHPFGRMGSPPGSIDNLAGPGVCQVCHNVAGSSIYAAWNTSAHGYAAVDPVFNAALHNAQQQVKDVERWCTQCHRPANWLSGHPLNAQDQSGIICSICHRAVDSESAVNIDQPAIDQARAMNVIPPRWKEIGGNGAVIVDPNDVRRGTNFLNMNAPHQVARSVFQGGSALCGACHSVYAPHLARDSITQEFAPGSPDIAHGENPLFLQSTYPEWLNSQYAIEGTQCQDCHMPTTPGYVAEPLQGGLPRNVPGHEIAGGNLFILDIFDQIGALGDTSNQRSVVSATLSRAALITATITGSTLNIEVTCEAGHKCPTGYEEGRTWILQVEQLDGNGQRIVCSGCWDAARQTISGYDAQLTDPDYDPELTEFGVRFGVTGTLAMQIGMTPGESFNLALNNTVISDTRIPPCGWDAAVYNSLGIAPTIPYAPGSCTALAHYQIQPGAHQVIVRLLHWSHTTPYLLFLRDAGGDAGQTLWDAWQSALAIGKGQPVVIASQVLSLP